MTQAPSSNPDGGREAAQRALVCLEFANTADWHSSDRPQETLHTYEDLLGWAVAHAVIPPALADALRRRSEREPQVAVKVHQRAIALREAVYRIFVARIAAAIPAQEDAALLNSELQRAFPQYRLDLGADGPAWHLATERAELDLPLWPIAQSAAELVLSETLRDRVGQCADPAGCGWLFLDLSKNRSRRWCSIQDCGNRAKQRRLQARLKEPR